MVDRNISIFMSCKWLIILNVVHYLSQFHSTFHKRIMVGYTSKNLFTYFFLESRDSAGKAADCLLVKSETVHAVLCHIGLAATNWWMAVFRREPHYLTLCSRAQGKNSKGNIVTT